MFAVESYDESEVTQEQRTKRRLLKDIAQARIHVSSLCGIHTRNSDDTRLLTYVRVFDRPKLTWFDAVEDGIKYAMFPIGH